MTKTLFRLAETEKSSDKEELKVNYSSSKLEQLTELSPTLVHTDFNYTMACSPNVFIKEVRSQMFEVAWYWQVLNTKEMQHLAI